MVAVVKCDIKFNFVLNVQVGIYFKNRTSVNQTPSLVGLRYTPLDVSGRVQTARFILLVLAAKSP